MGWNDLIRARTRALVCAVAAAGLAALGGLAGAQGTGGGTGTTTSTTTYSDITNNYLDLQIGTGTLNGGYVGLATTPKNPFDPFNDQQLGAGVYEDNMLVLSPPIANSIVSPFGTKIYLRVNGGFDKRLQNGWDYVIGTASNGTTGTVALGTDVGYWIQPPVQVGNSLVARWATLPFTYGAADIAPPWLPSDITTTGSNAGSTGTGNGGTGGTGGTGTGTGTTTGAYYINNQIEVDMYATLVGETVRLQLNIINQNTSTQTVGVFFAQNINVNPGPYGIETSDGPVRIPGSSNLVHETLLYGTQIPQYYETFDIAANTSATLPPHSIRGTLRPYASTESEPTSPTRLIYGETDRVNIDDSDIPPAYITAIKQLVAGRWDFIPDPTIILDLNGADASMGVVWDEAPVAPSQTRTIVTYIGGANSTSDFSPPMGLAVYGPTAIQYNGATSSFQVTALLHNFTDVTNVNGTTYDVGPVTVSLQLPPGLVTSSTPTQTLATLGPGTDGTCTWQVSVDPNNTAAATGTLTYAVSATPKLGNGKVVQRSIVYPASHTFPVPEPQGGTPIPIMLSMPFSTGSSIPTTVIPALANLPEGFQLTRYNPLNPNANSTNVANQLAAYEPQNSFTPGYAYWFWIKPGPNANSKGSVPLTVASQFLPLANQVQPNAQTYGIVYPQGYYGWNQIGDPYIYPYQFANINIFDPASGQVVDITTASSTSYGWISPAVYHFNVNSTNSNHLDLEDSFGFVMQPYDGYWIQVNKANLQFLYGGVDTPGAAVNLPLLASNRSLSATLGRNETNNWRLNLQATGATTADYSTYIGMSANAVDGPDTYKYAKPPSISNVTTMSIQHTDWGKKNGLYSQDMRSAAIASKTWNLLVQSAKANEEVHITWPGIAASVPRNISLTLIDPVTNTHTNMRTAGDYVIKTGSDSSRSLQVVAQQTSGAGITRIASLNINGITNGRAASIQSVSINYTLTQAADTQVVVRDSAGHAIRTITTSTTRADGTLSGTVQWDLKTDRGVAVSTGVYNIELNALGADGQLTRQVRPFVLSR